MTTGLERKAHRLVELSRTGDEPTAAELLSLHGAVSARIAAEGAITASAMSGSVKAASAGAFAKGLVVAAAIATGAGSFFVLRGAGEPLKAEAPPRASVVVPVPVVAPVLAPAPTADEVTSALVLEPPPPVAKAAAKPVGSPRLQDEAALLAEVQGALRGGDGARALAKLDGYDRRFPKGMLRAEADAARVFALCSAGRVDRARASAARFVQVYPRSPAAARVQAACR